MGNLGGYPLEAPVDVSVHQLNLLGGVSGGLQFGAELLAEHRLEELHPRGNPGRVREEVGADNELKSMRRLQWYIVGCEEDLGNQVFNQGLVGGRRVHAKQVPHD